jgi:type VI secretion system protein ImpI
MALHLKIENETNLPDGGPVSITVNGKRGIDIGRDAHLDWTLPDPTRYISGKHAEIRWREGGYWLHDVSTNGTLLNGADHRMQAPHRLRDGDRFAIGHYIIAVTLDAEQGELSGSQPPAAVERQPDYEAIWDNPSGVAPPIGRDQLRAPRDRPLPVNPDFLDWAADVPIAPTQSKVSSASSKPAEDPMDWSAGPRSPQPSPPTPPPDLPTPRRPQKGPDATNTWETEPARGGFTPFDQQQPSPETGPPPNGPSVEIAEFLQRFARALGVPKDLLATKDPGQLGDEIGAMLRVMVESLMQLLNARHQARLLVRSSHHTVIQAFDNNPLKFSPNVEEALRTMFAPPSRAYLPPVHAIERGFDDLKRHEIKTYSAMQHALSALVSELDPKSIDHSISADGGLSALLTSRKEKLWDIYVTRWEAQMVGQGNAATDRFMRLFSEYYDRDSV